jgi:hypothetical protein
MSYYNNFEGDKKPFNMAQLLLERLDKRLDELDVSVINMQFQQTYRILRTLLNAVYPFLKKDGKEAEITEYTNDLFKVSEKLKVILTQKNTENVYFTIEKDLNLIIQKIIYVLYIYKLYYPHYETKEFEEVFKEQDV